MLNKTRFVRNCIIIASAIILSFVIFTLTVFFTTKLTSPALFDFKDFNKAFSEKIIVPDNFYTVKDGKFEYRHGIFKADYQIIIGINQNPDTSDYRTLSDGNYIDAARPYTTDIKKILFIKVPIFQYEIHYLQGNFEAHVYVLSSTNPNLNGHKRFLKDVVKNINSLAQEN